MQMFSFVILLVLIELAGWDHQKVLRIECFVNSRIEVSRFFFAATRSFAVDNPWWYSNVEDRDANAGTTQNEIGQIGDLSHLFKVSDFSLLSFLIHSRFSLFHSLLSFSFLSLLHLLGRLNRRNVDVVECSVCPFS